MDQDGANHKYLTDGSALVLTPRFSPTRQEITYLSYFNDTPRVYLFDINTGRQEMLGAFQGMTFAPRFSPDGNSVIMSYAKDGDSDIWIMDLRTRRARQITAIPSIDTSPSYSPDGRQITFNSDRGGTQQLYVMDADGSNVRRISFGQGPLRDTGMVAARRPDRLYEVLRRAILYRGHAAGRNGRAPVDRKFPRRSADLVAERSCPDLLSADPDHLQRQWRRDENLLR